MATSFAGLAGPSDSAQPFQIQGITLDPAGRPQIRHATDPAAYYVLLRGSGLTDLSHPVDVRLGATGGGELSDRHPLSNGAFYRVIKLPQDSPGDLDRDGLDDVYELARVPALDPLNAADATADADGDERTNLQEFRAGTDPLRADFFVVTSPQHQETGISVNRETEFRFTVPLAPGTTLGSAQLWAEARGRRLLTRAELSSDRRTVSVFYLEPVPGLTRVRVSFDGTGVSDANGNPLDLDLDGRPGGVAAIEFTTAGFAAVPGTGVIGQVFASEMVPIPGVPGGFTNRPLAGVTVTVDGAEETLRTITDAEGRFTLTPCPVGRFFVHVDGRTVVDAAAGIRWPDEAYYPFVGKAWEAAAGVMTNRAGGTGEIFLPLIAPDALRSVSSVEATKIGFPAAVVAANPALAGVEIDVPPNALFADNGARGGRVGLAPVSPDRLPEPLPPGLAFPLVITVQTDGPQNFDQPVPVKFPNLPDARTGKKLGPGEKSALWSFDHDKGVWEIVGPMTVSADGLFVVSDPGVGIRQPGWHGTDPGTGGDGPRPVPIKTRPRPYHPPRPPLSPPSSPPPPPPPGPGDVGDDGDGGDGGGPGDDSDSPIPDFPELPEIPGIDVPGTWGELVSTIVGQLPTMGPDVFGPIVDIGIKGIDMFDELGDVIGSSQVTDSDGDGISDVEEARDAFLQEIADQAEDALPSAPENVDDLSDLLKEWWDIWEELYGGAQKALQSTGPRTKSGLDGQPPAAAMGPLTELRREATDLARLAGLQAAFDGYFQAVIGSNEWRSLAVTGVQFRETLPILRAMTGAQQAGTDGGALITPGEAAGILQLSTTRVPLAFNTNLITRLNQTTTENRRGRVLRSQGPPGSPAIIDAAEEQAAVGRILAEITAEADAGYRTPGDRGLALAERMGPALGGFFGAYVPTTPVEPSAENEFPVLLEIFPPGGGVLEQHLRTDSRGQLQGLRLPANALVIVRWLDPATLQIATSFFASGTAGSRFKIPQAVWDEHTPTLDSDGDGLPDVAEHIVGTSAHAPDSDDDGLLDGAEVRARTNPLDGIVLQPGIVGGVDTPGQAVDVALETYDLSAFGGAPSLTRILVADGPAGVAVMELMDGQPALLGQLDTPGDARRVALPPSGSLIADEVGLGAFADGAAGLGIVDLADPVWPRLAHQIALTGTTLSVAIFGGVAYAGTDAGSLFAVDLFTGETLDQLDLGYPIHDLKVHDGHLFIVGPRLGQVSLQAVPLLEGGFFGNAGSPANTPGTIARRGLRLAVGDGLAYTVHGKGYHTWSITNLAEPSLVATGTTTQFGWFQLAPNGSGLGIACVGPNASDDGAHDISVYDVSDPTQTERFLRTIVTPGLAAGVATHEGLAYVADTAAGLQVIQYQASDRGGNAPAVTLRGLSAAEVVAGSRVVLSATAVDDVAVRAVELYVNGALVASDHTWPYEFAITAPPFPRVSANGPGRAVHAVGFTTNLTFQVRAVDTVGAAAWSATAAVRVVPDTIPPQVARVEPVPGQVADRYARVMVSFNEPLDQSSISPETVQVLSAGADLVFGTADDGVVSGAVFSFLERANRVFLEFPGGLPHGDYLVVVAGTVRDASGNAMGLPFTSGFRVRQADLRNGGSFEAQGELADVGWRDVYGLEGNAGQRLFFDLQSRGGLGLRWTLLDPEGKTVFRELAFFDIGTVELPVAGHYQLILERIGAVDPAYHFQVWDVPAPQAFPIRIGDVVSDGVPAAGAGRIETPGVQDAYTFVATPGQAVFFDLQDGATSSLRWQLFDETGELVFAEGLFFDPGWMILTRGGMYTLTVDHPRSDYRGTYRFQIWDVPAPQVFTIQIGDTVSDGVPAAGAGNLETPGVMDVYTFHATPGQEVFFDLQQGGTAAVQWRLTDEAGAVVFDEGFFFDSGVITLDRGGTYTLAVGVRRTDHRGTYRFQLWAAPPAQNFAIAIGDTVSDGVPAAGAGNLESPGALDVYTFTAAAGQRVFLDLQQGGTAATRWRLTDEAGVVVFDEGFFFDPGVLTLARGGTYTLTVGTSRTDHRGTYRFRLLDVPADQHFAIAVGDTVSNGFPAAGAGNIETPGVVDVYTFTATAGQVVFFDYLEGGSGNQRWRLTDEAGATVFDEGFFFDPGEQTLTRGGIYTLTVGNPRSDLIGAYRFQLRNVR